MHKQLVTTSDGSHSIYIPEFKEHYHSIHGAIRESKHVFIEVGLKFVNGKENPIKILEVGLGTGLNCFLTYLENIELKKTIECNSIEAFPLDEEILKQLNYVEQLDAKKYENIFTDIHQSNWNEKIELANNFIFKKINDKLQNISFNETYDLVYFDAFAPSVQSEMWTKDVFEKIYNSMNKGAVLVTYCAKGEVKRTLKSVGFEIETLPGPPGKREMTRARKL